MKEKVIELLKSELWNPKNPTPYEFDLAHHYNMLIHDLISKVMKLEEESLTEKIINGN